MNWNVICRVGENDNFALNTNREMPRLVIEFDETGKSKLADNKVSPLLTKNGFGINETVFDLLILAMSVYMADLRIERSFATDRWTRLISLHLPVAE